MFTRMRRIALSLLATALLGHAPLGAQTLTTIQNAGPSANRVDVLFLGDGYTASELGKFTSDVAFFVDRFFAESPFSQYRAYFNVHRLDVVSAESGADHPSTGVFRNTALGAYYDCNNIERLICLDWTAVDNLLAARAAYTQRDAVVVIVNDAQYGGSGGSFSVASTHPDAYEVVLHEIGHSFGLLADEYVEGPDCSTASEPIEPNVTANTSRSTLKWRAWIGSATPLPTTSPYVTGAGLYAGGRYCASGIYRPTYASKMRYLFEPFGPVNTEQLVKRMYNFTSPIDAHAPTASLVTTRGAVTFSVRPLSPSGHVLDVSWLLDGVEISSGVSATVDTRSLAAGDHSLRVVVADPTPLVASDADQVLRDVRTWTIRVDATPPSVSLGQPAAGASLAGTVAVTATATDNLSVARVEFFVDGALRHTDTSAPYSFSWNTTTAADGAHTVYARAVDASGNAASSPARTVTVANATAGTLPPGWTSADVGAVGVPGSATASGATYTITGAGADIWGTADGFRFAYRQMSGDMTIVARLTSIAGGQAWTKAGIMIRASTAAGSQHASMLLSPGNGLAFQHRRTAGGLTTHVAGPVVAAPYWLQLQRAGNLFTASASADGRTWSVVSSQTISMTSTVLAGFAVTSHTTTATATGTFDGLTMAATLPVGWSGRDIGAVAAPGRTTYSGGAFSIDASGADIWGTADEFHFASRSLTGDGVITARVASLTNTHASAKAGLMIRETLVPGAKHAFVFATPGKGLGFERRLSTGGTSLHTAGPVAFAPYWLRLRRAGGTITAYASPDAVTWTTIGTQDVSMAATVYIGLAVTSHSDGITATARFTDVAAPQ